MQTFFCKKNNLFNVMQVSEVSKGKTEASLNLQVAKDELNRIKQSLANQPTSEDITEVRNRLRGIFTDKTVRCQNPNPTVLL